VSPAPLRARLLSARGPGGVAVVELSGPGALERARALAGGAALAPGTLRLVRLEIPGEGLDEALVVVLEEARVELHLHGSPPLVQRVLELCGGPSGAHAPPSIGVRAHAPPSIGVRAHSPPSIELRAQALLGSGGAPCEAAARILLDQQAGALRRELEELAARAASPDFGDRLARLVERGRIAARAFAPARVLLAGPVNSGKSTLFNLLVARERAVVSAEPGTTRDALIERVRLGAWPVDVIDTAGAREVPSGARLASVERAGQERALAARLGADLVLWLVPPEAAQPAPGDLAGAVRIHSLADLVPPAERREPWISALRDPARALATVGEVFRARLGLPEDPWLSGAGVPFEPEQMAALRSLGRSGGADERRAALRSLLEN
jgi:tRNA modification GTPase